MAVEVLVEVGVAVDGIAPDDQPSDPMRTQLNGRQEGGRRGRLVLGLHRGRDHRGNAGGDPRSLVQEFSAAGGRSAGICGDDSMKKCP